MEGEKLITQTIENRLEMLKALRAKLAYTIDNSESGRDIAALSKQLREVALEIDGLEEPQQKAVKTPLELIRAKHVS